MRLERIKEELIRLGGKNIRIKEAYTQNHPDDPEGWELPPLIFKEEIKAEGLTKGEIDMVIAKVDKEIEDNRKAIEEDAQSQFEDRLARAFAKAPVKDLIIDVVEKEAESKAKGG